MTDGVRLVTIQRNDRTMAAALLPDAFVVLEGGPYPDVASVLGAGAPGLAAARRAGGGEGERYRLSEARLRRPVLDPGLTVCVGLNSRSHLRELGREMPSAPTLFAKVSRALADPDADVPLPRISSSVDYEAELALVIGRGGSDIPLAEAWDAVAGVTLINDVSMRDLQKRTRQVFAGKNFERSTPVGPAVMLLDDPEQFSRLRFELRVNGSVRQRGRGDDLIFDVPALVHDISKIVSLRPGDLIATGTPAGVGMHMDPAGYLREGDIVEVEAAGIGTLRNRFIAPGKIAA